MAARDIENIAPHHMADRKTLLKLLCLIALISVTAALLSTLAFTANSERDTYLSGLIDQTGDYMRAAAEPRLSHSAEDYQAVFGPMVEEGALAGAIVLDKRGGVVKQVGDGPSPDLRDRLTNPGAFHRPDNDCCIDVFFAKRDTRFDHDIILRIPALIGVGGIGDGLWRWAGFALFGMLIGTSLALAAGYFLIVIPLGAFKLALLELVPPGAKGKSFGSQTGKRAGKNKPKTETKYWGGFARDLRRLQADLAVNLTREEDELSASLEALPFEILMFDNNGQLLAANEAALWLYKAKNISELRRRGMCRFGRASDVEPMPRSILEVFAGGARDFDAVVYSNQDEERRRLTAREMRDDQGMQVGYAVALLASQFGDEDGPEGLGAGGDLASPMGRQAATLKLQLEACLTLLNSHDREELGQKSQPIRCDLIVENWFLAMATSGLICDDMTHELPGQMIGDYDTVESLLRFALTVVALRSQSAAPSLEANGTMRDDGQVEFVFEEKDGAKLPEVTIDPAGGAEAEDWKLSLAALSQLLRAYGGKVSALRGPNDCNLLRIVMRSRPQNSGAVQPNLQKSVA